MSQNVEIKARISDVDAVHETAVLLSGGPSERIEQEDVFFPAPNGRLKLRIFSPVSGELIFYTRSDAAGPKMSQYQLSSTGEPLKLRALLGTALGERIIVRKLRHLYLVGRTRIHVDQVEGLGDFLELEVVMAQDEPFDQGEAEARTLMSRLGIKSDDLIEGAYADLLVSV